MPLMKSWITSANSAETDFPLNNLPYGVFSVGDDDPLIRKKNKKKK